MKHTYYHVLTDQHSEYLTSLEDAKSIAAKWKREGDSHIKISKTIKKEYGDTIFLDEEKIPSSESFKNWKMPGYNKTSELSAIENYEKKIDKLTEVINSCPTDAGLFFNRATLKIHIGDIKGARSDFRKSEYIHRSSNYEFMD